MKYVNCALEYSKRWKPIARYVLQQGLLLETRPAVPTYVDSAIDVKGKSSKAILTRVSEH